MQIAIEDARRLVIRCFVVLGMGADEAAVIADQIIDIELRGEHFGGMSRALSIARMVSEGGRTAISVVRETPNLVLLDGGNTVGYVVVHQATNRAIEKARATGVGIGAANNTFFTGQFSYYLEMATRAGFVAIAMGASGPSVAPFGASEARFGTNPIAFGIPTIGDPVIVDIGTSQLMVGDLHLAARTGKSLPEGAAYDAEGKPTTDPNAALGGAIAAWGGHKGAGIGMAMQMIGIMIGAATARADHRESAYFLIVIDPAAFGDAEAFKQGVAAYADTVLAARPIDPAQPPRLPFSRSAAERRARLAAGYINVPDTIVESLNQIAAGGQT